MDIEFLIPLKMGFDAQEDDERIPSMKFKFHVVANQFTHSLQYEGEVWIACGVFDKFIDDLTNMANVAILESLDECFAIEIARSKNCATFSWRVKRIGVSDELMSSKFESKVTEDDISKIRSSFLSFPKWW